MEASDKKLDLANRAIFNFFDEGNGFTTLHIDSISSFYTASTHTGQPTDYRKFPIAAICGQGFGVSLGCVV